MESMQDVHSSAQSAIRLERADLGLVLAVAESDGVTRAASLLHLSQSALSRRPLDLEARVGARSIVSTQLPISVPRARRIRRSCQSCYDPTPILAAVSLVPGRGRQSCRHPIRRSSTRPLRLFALPITVSIQVLFNTNPGTLDCMVDQGGCAGLRVFRSFSGSPDDSTSLDSFDAGKENQTD